MDSLDSVQVGSEIRLSADESRHVHVLRLKAGSEIEVVDPRGRCARAVIEDGAEPGVRARIVDVSALIHVERAVRLVLGVAWPKGKRAAVLVEKCAELGVDEIVPIEFDRGVVSKADESEGLVRLRRIAAEASKQSRRNDTMCIGAEMTLPDFLTRFANVGLTLILDPYHNVHLLERVSKLSGEVGCLALIIGPEGGMTDGEIALAERMGADKVQMAVHVLRIETAAIAAGAICRAILDSRKSL